MILYTINVAYGYASNSKISHTIYRFFKKISQMLRFIIQKFCITKIGKEVWWVESYICFLVNSWSLNWKVYILSRRSNHSTIWNIPATIYQSTDGIMHSTYSNTFRKQTIDTHHLCRFKLRLIGKLMINKG